MAPQPVIRVDRTHLSRRASGIERITRDLFSDEALAPLPVAGADAAGGGRAALLASQMLRLPAAALADRRSVWVFSGYPPAPPFAWMPERTVLYVHDLFLITRAGDLNRAGRLYLAPLFRLALKRLRYFFVNSEATGRELAAHVGPDAEIRPYRPKVANVFGLAPRPAAAADDRTRPLIVGGLGTIEPRKNFPAAAAICAALERRLGRPVEFHLVGRPGWGPDHAALAGHPNVRLHGFLGDEEARRVIGSFDVFLCTSHDEGLGLPLLETQYAGLPVVAPDQAVFHEVLGASGTFIAPQRPEEAAAALAALIAPEGWRQQAAAAALANVARWNAQAEGDRAAAVAFLWKRLAAVAGPS